MIRQGRASDEPAVRRCAELAFARYVPRIGRMPAPMLADFHAQIAAGDLFIAVDDDGQLDDGQLAGYIVFYAEGDHVMLESVAVMPAMTGRGIGAALIGFCENDARQQGFVAVRLYTNEAMTENLAIYPRLGYVETGRRVEDGFKRAYFEKALT